MNSLNHCYWEGNVCLDIKICEYGMFGLKLNKYCQTIEVVVRASETQLQAGEDR